MVRKVYSVQVSSYYFLTLKNINELPTTMRIACQDNILRSVFLFDDVIIFVSNHITFNNSNLHQT